MALCCVLLHINLQLAATALQSFAALQTVRLASQALSDAVQAAADSAEAAQAVANRLGNHLSDPPMIAQMGGLPYLMPEAMKLVLSLMWKSPHSALTN